MESKLNDLLDKELSEVQIEVKRIKPGSRYHYDLYNEFGNVILKAQTPFSQELLSSLMAENITYVYYDPARVDKDDSDNVMNLNTSKNVVSNDIQREAISQAKELFDQIRDIMSRKEKKSVDITRVNALRSVVKNIIGEIDANQDAVFSPLVSLKNMDEYEYQHATNVAVLISLVMGGLEANKEARTAMGVGGLFHDIGKSSLAEDILKKARILDDDFDEIREHPHVGYKIVEQNGYMHDLEKRSILLHHERTDGNGYPFGFSMDHFTESQPREIRLLTLCNVFEALIVRGPSGEEPYTPHNALRKMLNLVQAPYKTVHHFLPSDFRDFVKSAGFTVNGGRHFLGQGDVIRLVSGEIAIIEKMNKLYPLKPNIRIITNRDLQPLKRQIQVDMIQDMNIYIANVYDRSSTDEKKFSA